MLSVKTNSFKVVATFILTVGLLASLFGFKCFSSSAPGNSAENPIVVDSVQDLEALVEDINDGNSCSGKYFKLRKDIAVKEDNKIFSNGKEPLIKGKFNGTFDGNGYTINFKTKNKTKDEKRILFDSLGKNAMIKNLNIKGNIKDIALEKNNNNIKNCRVLED